MRTPTTLIYGILVVMQLVCEIPVHADIEYAVGKYCAKSEGLYDVSLHFVLFWVWFHGKYLTNEASARRVDVNPDIDTRNPYIWLPVNNNTDLAKALDDLKLPINKSELEWLYFANDQITAITSLGNITLTPEKCDEAVN
ncbi:hypothetical protein FOL47_005047 [Perkinsus chesapeaki]|uniref:Uncharacterized protein n=1 Tax=Perkinsus chesapeaki TaxID=330153 RepID=A0A7J6LZF4_PERCH|nr:hypothetical protein FOL47_005047 [Perkinsus chesapeaki]